MSAFHYGLCLKDHEELDYVLIKNQPSQSKSTVIGWDNGRFQKKQS